MENNVLGIDAEHNIESLAHRWNRAATVYLQHADYSHLVWNEDFCDNKTSYIRSLARRLDLPVTASIAPVVETQHQPKGNRTIPCKDFFGTENLSRIEHVCADNMQSLNYTL